MKNDETIPAVLPDTLEIAGVVSRKFAHKFGVPHGTVLLLAVRNEDCKVALYSRSEMQTQSGKLDGFGGHVLAMLGASLGTEAENLETLSCATGIREGNEELRLLRPDCEPYWIDRSNAAKHLRLVGRIGEFRMASPSNVECSSLYILRIPTGYSTNPYDEVDGKIYPVALKWFSLEELLLAYQKQSESFADGMGRILQRATDDMGFKTMLQRMIQEN